MTPIMNAPDAVEYDPFAGAALEKVVPTTEAQREVWLADRLGRDASLAYNESISLHFSGPLDTAALQAALDALVNRHEALRSTFSDDGLEMHVAGEGALPAQRQDLGACDEAGQAAAIQTLLDREVETRFDLGQGPLIRAHLLRLGALRHQLVLTAHHIVCDGWSFAVIAHDLMQAYRQHIGLTTAVAEAAAGFGEFAVDLVSAESAKAAADDEAYWLAHLQSPLPVLDLPADRARPARRSYGSRRIDVALPEALAGALRGAAGRAGVTLFSLLCGTFAATLARLAGTSEVIVGVPSAAQAGGPFESMVGHAVNMLPMRFQIDLGSSAKGFLAGVQTTVLDAQDHPRCTFGAILKKLPIPRDPSRPTLVSVVFNLDDPLPLDALAAGPLSTGFGSNPRRFENFELFLNVTQAGPAVRLECQYNTQLFDEATVRRWLALYSQALARCAADATQPVAQLLAPGDDDIAMLARFNATEEAVERDVRIETLIKRQARATPDAIAVKSGRITLSYGELDQRAAALARHLSGLGVAAGDLVGLTCGRNEHMLVALLGILKSGAGYLPLDPAFPSDRLEFMASDAGLRFVVTDSSARLPWKFGAAQAVAVDELAMPTDVDALPHAGSADDVAYVIYTSGSTGRPKGVRVPHRTVVNLLTSLRAVPGIRADHRMLAVTTLSFDIAVSEVIMPLTVGACIVVAEQVQATDGERLRALIEAEQVNCIDATPSTWRLLLTAGWRGRGDLLAICTGEPLPPDLGRQLLPLVGELWNGYGPTETTVWSSFHRVLRIDGPVPIGRPVANTRFHVLDAALRPLPVGAIGELYIAGDGVTLGYLARPELTAERFLPDPTSSNSGARIYRTGDLGRWRSDGILECLGRIDNQVKVRGYRIELGEIEAACEEVPGVAQCIVMAREDNPGDVRLVGYLTRTADAAAFDEAALRDHMRAKLPVYMLLQHVVVLQTMPILPNGKVDRKSLPPPYEVSSATRAERVPPRNPLEASVLATMESVLKLPGLGIHDDFFALGGHSLLAAQLTARLNHEFSLHLPLRALFESPTPERLAIEVEKAQGMQGSRREPIHHVPDRHSAPLTPMQERIRFIEQLHPGRVLYNTPSAHRLIGPMDVAKFTRALQEVVRRQPSLRTWIAEVEDGHGWRQSILPELQIDLPFEDLSGLPETEHEAELMRRMQAIVDTPMDIQQAPLFRVALYRLAPEHHAFLFMPHHIIWDGWSFDLLYEEMAGIYGALAEGRAHAMPPLAVTYGDYAQWLETWSAGPEFARQLAWWKDRFAKAPMPKALRTDRPRRAGQSGEGAAEWVRVDKVTTERLRQVAREADVTLNMLTMSVYAAMMAGVLGGESVVLGVPVRGRQMMDLEPVMGFFNNLLPVQVEVRSDRSVLDFARELKADLLELFSNQEVPFERLATEPEVAARTQKVGLYQALFSFQDARERRRHWGPLSHQSILIFQKGATEDLGLWLMEVPHGLEGGVTYNADIYTAQTAAAFRERYLELLHRLADHPFISLSDLTTMHPSASAQHLRQLARDDETTATPRQEKAVSRRPPSEVELSAEEDAIAQVWAALLGVDAARIRADDSFAAVGGSAELAVQAVAATERSLGFKLEPGRYMNQSIGQLVMASSVLGAKPAAGQAATNPAEQALAGIWASLLNIDVASILPQDNFFDLGGNSLLAMRAAGEMSKQLGASFNVRRLIFESLAQLANTPAGSQDAVTTAADEAPQKAGLFGRLKSVFKPAR